MWVILLSEFIVGLGLWAGIIGNLSFMQSIIPSDFHKSLILATGMLAGLLAGPLAGKLIDQMPKRKVLIWSQVGRIVSVLLMFVAIYTNSIIWMIFFMIGMQVSAAFFMPAIQAVIPMVVERSKLMELNAWHMNVRTISRIVGTAAAGLLLTYVDVVWLYVVSLVMYSIMLVVIHGFHLPEEKVEAKIKQKTNFMEVWPLIQKYPMVVTALCLTIIPTLFLGSFNLMIINIVEMHDKASLSGLIYTLEGIGFMSGAFLVKRLSDRIKPVNLLFLFAFMMSILDMSLALANIEWMPLITFASFGFCVGCFFPTVMTIFQKDLPKEYHGRFFSFRNMLDTVVFQVVLLSAGGMLDLIGLQWMGIVFGVISIGLFVYFFINARRKQPLPAK